MTVKNLRHKTCPTAALEIITSRQYHCKDRNILGYDAGMNFLGELGELNNHGLHHKTVTLICSWDGLVSGPMPWKNLSSRQANLLCDYNGSGNHFQNNDPRYFLPIGSDGLTLNAIEFTDESAILYAWLDLKRYQRFRSWRMGQARRTIAALKKECESGTIRIKVC
ncbi:hypothetical protein [Variovorax sp. PCZ-1]|uniref:hypothetical protein n=1 Tax=Variovorax sp. PCZ-1 TaxID=2835533 RepID=UPI001BCBC15A|nr:hypothetical protein [Variovorax sp. PCZ-1]MBS7809272.1 hypothetical protein [Variovorax sp. PCZ-1]